MRIALLIIVLCYFGQQFFDESVKCQEFGSGCDRGDGDFKDDEPMDSDDWDLKEIIPNPYPDEEDATA